MGEPGTNKSMTSIKLDCRIRSGEVRAANKKNVLSEGPGNVPIDRFFDDHKQLLDNQAYERPSKRQRLEYDDTEDDTKVQFESRIPIARISLNLASSQEYHDLKHENDKVSISDRSNALEVGVVGVEKVGQEYHGPYFGPPPPFVPCPVTITLTGPMQANKGPLLTFELADKLSKEAYDVLNWVAYLERRNRLKKKERGVAHSRCQLTRSNGSTGGAYKLDCTILWSDGESAFGPLAVKKYDEQILTTFYPDPEGEPEQEYSSGKTPKWNWAPQDFYDSVYSPATDAPLPDALNRKVLETELYPFQKRAVAWMLHRENGKKATSDVMFSKAKNADHGDCYISHLQGVVSSPLNLQLASEPPGGILAEEMGLGKTCELIALICLNQRPGWTEPSFPLTNEGQGLISSRATLIVTPGTILQQWEDEIRKHAPSLSVMHYTGMPPASKAKLDESQILHDFATKDVILTTYSVLAREVHFAIDPPDRSLRRRETKRERIRSPLVRMNWWRVCLDEAQMVESGVSAAAKVAALLPRENAWAVSGTPLRKDVEDLFGLLIFLRYQPFSDSAVIWKRLITRYKNVFQQVFGRITLRHTKEKIRGELRLPPQKRVVLTMPFTAIEDQNYRTLVEEMCEDVGCSTDGAPLTDQWDPQSASTSEKMRSWLARLRQTCLHPQVGGRNRRALGRGTAPLRTVAEVLEVMIDQNEAAVRTEARLAISSLLLKAHIIANAKDDERRAIKALDIYKTALKQAEDIVSECRVDLQKLGGSEDTAQIDEDSGDESSSKSPEQAARVRSRTALHSALQMQHACAFFVGTAYFQIKSNEALTKPESDEFKELELQETSFYDLAKMIRKELLHETSTKAEKLMGKIIVRKTHALKATTLSNIEGGGGIENMRIVHKARDLADLFDAQAELIGDWGSKVVELLLKPLVDEDEGLETTGDEYEDSTKQQDTLYAYIDALRAIVADRNTCITGQSAPLIDHEMNVLIRDARESKGHDPELLLKLLDLRSKLKQKPDGLVSLRGLTHEARGLETSLQWHEGSSARAGAEVSILQRQMRTLTQVNTDETKTMTELEKELELFRATMNQRLEFYRQLQYISDTVAPYKEDLDETLDVRALEQATKAQESRARALAQLKTKQRFLEHLRDESSSTSATERMCVICQCPFELGVLTICGHQYCKECIQHWWKAHKTCPVCKRRLHSTDFHDVTYRPQELRAQEETHTNSESSSPGQSETTVSLSTSLYSDIGSETLLQIKSIELNGSYGTKIDTLARHILWLREHDPGAKSIVFSQYREFLDVLSTAFKQFGIGHSRMGNAKAIDRFKQDASIEVFLLDAKTDSSGLNLTNAQYVFLAEPLINTAIELQAIARVHRIGQQRTTTVYMYLIGDTVEESIYDISVTRRLEHMQKGRGKREESRSATPMLGEAAIDAANSLELQQAPLSKLLVKGRSGGEVVAQSDLWACLFGKASSRKAVVSDGLQAELGRHLRAEAAEERRS